MITANLIPRLTVVNSRVSRSVYDACRIVHVWLQVVANNLVLVFKYQQPCDRIERVKIRLTDVSASDMVVDEIVLSANILSILKQISLVLPVEIV